MANERDSRGEMAVDHRSVSEPPTHSQISFEPFGHAETRPTDGPLFEMVDVVSAGVDFLHQSSSKPGSLRANTVGCGLCLGDYDGDGRVDIFLCDSSNGGQLFRNLGGFKFEEATAQAGLEAPGVWSTGATFVDVEGDGDLDLYVCSFDSPNRLYVNQGDGTFVERAHEFGLDYRGSSTAMTFADYDGDGDLDGYLVTNYLPPEKEVTYRLERDSRGVPYVPQEFREFHDLIALPGNEYGVIEAGQFDHLYRNNGDSTFSDVTEKAGMLANHKGLAAIWWDYNGDNRPDLYVANDFYGPDHLYRNQGDGTFVDVARKALPHTPWFSMGCDLGDLNNDGLIDFVASDMAGSNHYREKMTSGDMETDAWFLETAQPRQYMRNAVYLNAGVDRMIEAGCLLGLTSTDWTWAIKLEDFDQDGRIDAFVTNGMNRDWENSDLHRAALKLGPPNSPAYDSFWKDQGRLEERNFAFRNQGDLHFEEVGAAWGVDFEGVSYGAAVGDLDGDGDLDLVVNNMDDRPAVYRNVCSGGQAVRVRLRGHGANPWGIGATVRLETDDGPQVRYLTPVRGFMSGDDATVHFGLGDVNRIERLTVLWPSGRKDEFVDLAVDGVYTISEGDGEVAPVDPLPQTIFVSSKRFDGASHREATFNDFAAQPLLPRRLSRLGPGLAIGDVDGDRRNEIFLTGARRMTGQLLREDGTGKFVERELFPVWGDDSDAESLGAAFVDADLDGDLDLYVVNGGVECAPDAQALADRLYLNNGNGQFEHAPEDMVPDDRQSGSCVAAADFDRDGDLDLFVGGRCVPGAYPELPPNRLLVNQQGRYLEDDTAQTAAIRIRGMATAAVWSDANDDGWIDLVVAYDWGPLRLFLNHQGQFEDATESAGIAELTGWWNGLAATDVDNDGDIDYVATNFGLNSRYQPTMERPARLLYHDWEGLGRRNIVEAITADDGSLLPIRGKGTMQKVFATVEMQCPTYDAYARTTLREVFGDEALQQAQSFAATTLKSGVFLNDGSAHFTFLPLPPLAQVAPAFGVACLDADGDGRCDLFLGQNFRGMQREAGNMDGGLGILLRGEGDGRFEPVWPLTSGIVVPGEARAVTVADLNDDHQPDLLIGVNDEKVLCFEHQDKGNSRYAVIRLQGPVGNPQAIGARVTIKLAQGETRCFEISGGGGYLTHGAGELFVALSQGDKIESISVIWPNGTETHHPGETVPAGGRLIVIDSNNQI